ncbi:MAG: carbohydrate ABC transporter permease [Spirochaetes bacterium]|nr:carbohydrate ABC transporter permease [Spirochaetota bacterium]
MKSGNTLRSSWMIGVMISASFLMLAPFFLMLTTSLKSSAELKSIGFSIFPKEISFANYLVAMQRGKWVRYFYNSFVITTVTVLVSLVINSMAGYAFARLRFRGRQILFISSLIGMMIPPQTTMIPVFIMLRHFPLVGGNDLFGSGGIGLINSYTGLVIPFIAGSFGVFLFRQYYLNFPHSLDDAAEIDGVGKLRCFLWIYVPLSKPAFATLGALKATQTWNEYIWPLIMTTTSDMRTVQLALALFRDEHEIQWNYLMSATTIITIPLVVLFLFAQRFFVEGIVTTGIKG